MTVLTMRRIRDDCFVVSGPDLEQLSSFKTRREARDWCHKHYRGSPIHEVGANGRKKITPSKTRPEARDGCVRVVG